MKKELPEWCTLALMGIYQNPDNKFNQHIRNMNVGDPLKYGDIISIPTDYMVLNMVIDSNLKDSSGDPIATPFIYADVKNILNGEEKRIRFFPNQLAKSVFPVDDNGKRLPKIITKGSAAAYYATFDTVDEAMESLKGRKIEIRSKTTCKTERYGDRQIVNTDLYEYEFCDKHIISKKDSPYLKYNERQTAVTGVNDNSIEKVYIPDNIYDIEKYAFWNCKNLRAIFLNEVHKIHRYAFRDCSSLKRIDIPWKTNYIDKDAFAGCTSLGQINVQSKKYYAPIEDYECDIPVEGYYSEDGILYLQYHDVRKHTLTLILVPQNHHSTHLVLPSNVTRIGPEALLNCKKIKSITLPKELEECYESAFSGCDSLENIIVPKYTIGRFEKLLPSYKHLLKEQID